MKLLPSVLPILISLLLLISCEKELSIENDPPSAGTLKSLITGDCLSSALNGIYKAATPLSADNYLDVEVDITAIGSYSISSDTVNGISFIIAGSITATGINTVRLQANGTPIVAGTHNFKVKYLGSSCLVSVTTLPANAVQGVYLFATSPDGSCTGAVLNGVYKTFTPTGSSNTASLAVNVTTPGTYSITTDAVNGITFSAAGIFTATGVQNLALTASGTPSAVGDFNVSASVAGTSCTFGISVAEGTIIQSVYTLGGAGVKCTGFALNGTYTSGVAMSAANTASIEVNVTLAGAFTLSTAAVNGVTFAASGTFTATGTQLLTLLATGTPIAAGPKDFAVSGGGAACSFNVTFESAAVPAVFTLTGSPGACTGAVIKGTYQAFMPLTTANTVILQVDVASPGTYSISTNTVNGIKFFASGLFTAAGMGISVTLTGSGTPLGGGLTTFTSSAGNTGCTFEITVGAAPTGIFNCKIDGVYNSYADRSSASVFDKFTGTPVPYLYLHGYTTPPNGGFVSDLQINIVKNDNSTVGTGTYDENHWIPPGTYRIAVNLFLENPDQSVTIWGTSSNFTPPPRPAFTITVTSRTASTIKGTFSGKVTNTFQGSTIIKTITEGVFDLPIR